MPRTTKPPSIQSQSREPDSKAFIDNLTRRPVEIDPIEEIDCLFGEYQTIKQEELVIAARKEEIRLNFEQRLIAQDEEGEGSYIESSDGLMRFSLVKTEVYKGTEAYEEKVEKHRKSGEDLKDLLKKLIRHGKATHLKTKISIRFTGPKIK